jgi:hypothetical protein
VPLHLVVPPVVEVGIRAKGLLRLGLRGYAGIRVQNPSTMRI